MKTNEILQLIGEQVFLDKVYQYAYRRCNTSHEAEDLCSDIILAVISAVHKQEHIDNFYAFVWTIARRVYADFSEKRSRAQQTVSIENEGLSLPAKANEIDQFIEETAQREELRRIFREIAFLSKAYREVMVLYYLDEMKVADIAARLGISETTVKQRLFSARNTVRKEVETMSERKLSLKPMTLGFIGTGSPPDNDPVEKAERLLSQNLVYACKDKAKTAKELSEELCVPMVFIEDELTIQVKGKNGSYGLLRKEGDKYIANVLVVDEDEFNEANGIYNKYADALCARLKKYLNENRDRFLDFPYLSEQTDLRFILWTLISESVWFTRGKVADILESKYFQNVKQPDRPFTVVAVANDGVASEDEEFYGCDGNATYDLCGYPYVFISSIYGKRVDACYYCGQRIAEDAKLRLLLKSIGGLSVVDLSEEQKEVAAKAIECGFLRKVGDVLEPRIVAIEKKDWDAFGKLLQGYYDSLDDICQQMAEEIHEYIVSHIQKHLMGEWKFYNQLIVGSHVIYALVEKCIAEDMLTVPENRLGPEGVLLVVEK